MNNEKPFLRIIKFIVVIVCVFGIIGRLNIPNEISTTYMCVVNIISIFIAVNLLMYDCYAKLYKRYKTSNINIIKKIRTWNLVMFTYILIFICNIILILGIYYLYMRTSFTHEVLNDILGISSLGFAISTDFLSEFAINIVWYLVNR